MKSNMNLIFENWRGFLNESLMLKPGKNGWELYAQLVGKAYLAAPKFEDRALPSFEAMIPFVDKMYKRVTGKINIEPVPYHAYPTAGDLRADVRANKRMKVATIDSEHDVFDLDTNIKFRAIHDYLSHHTGIKSRGTEFNLFGELQSYNIHLHTTPPAAVPALFTEVVGQVCAFYTQTDDKPINTFAEQKICLLDGFDYYKIGKVDGYDIVNKELVKR